MIFSLFQGSLFYRSNKKTNTLKQRYSFPLKRENSTVQSICRAKKLNKTPNLYLLVLIFNWIYKKLESLSAGICFPLRFLYSCLLKWSEKWDPKSIFFSIISLGIAYCFEKERSILFAINTLSNKIRLMAVHRGEGVAKTRATNWRAVRNMQSVALKDSDIDF